MKKKLLSISLSVLMFSLIFTGLSVSSVSAQTIIMFNGSTSTCSGNFYDSGDIGGNYSNGENFTHTINPSSPGSSVQAVFNAFDLESGFDNLNIYDGPTIGSPLIGTFTGTTSPGTIVSSDPSGALTFQFTSDGSVTRAGWQAAISCSGSSAILISDVSPTVTCSADFYDSGDIGGNYSNGENFTHTINPDIPGNFVQAVFNAFDLESGFDNLNIYDGPTIGSPLIGTFTGTTSPGTIVSSDPSGALTFQFTSDGSVTRAGWQAAISCSGSSAILISDVSPTVTCSADFYDSGDIGGDYSNGENFTHTINPDIPGNFVQAVFNAFDLESGFDNLNIYDGPTIGSPLIGTFTGTTSPGTIVSSDPSGALTFQFTSDGSVTRAGWQAAISCSGSSAILISDVSPTVTCSADFYDSGDIGGNYSNGENFTHTINPDIPGNFVQAVFNAFDLESGFDNLNIYDGPTTGSPLIGTFTGTTSPGTIVSSDPSGALTFQFTSDASVTRAGWQAAISCIAPPVILISDVSPTATCSADFYDSGDIGGNYSNGENFTHTINPATPGNSVQAIFNAFDLENGFDNLNIYDGPTIGSPLIGTFTGTTSPGTIVSSDPSGALTFQFTSDGSVTRAGWQAAISCVVATCTSPDLPTLTASATTICPSGTSTLTISGNLNDATEWNIYSASCGGSLVGTTSTTTFAVNPTTTTTYFIRGEGGCVVPGSCESITITVDDAIAPVADVASLANVTEDCSATPVAPTATDNCAGTVTGTPDVSFPITAQGTTTVTWTYDDGNGNTATQTQDVVITDAIAPVADNAALTNVTDDCSATPVAPTATDNCAGTVTGTPDVSFPITAQGTTTVTWTYDDGNGNTSTQTQDVVITDAIAPVADVASLANVTEDCSATPVAPTATDNCAGTVTGTPDMSFPITAQGTTTVTWTYDDGNGNTSTQTQDVIITDAIAPVADVASLANVTEDCSATPVAPTATDNCAGTVTGTPDVSFPITAQGTTTVTWTYDDGNGNTSTQTQDVIITDAIAPVADNAALTNVTDDCSATPVAPTATDNCAGTVTGTPDVSFPITAQGTTTVTWTYDDGNGNTATQTQDVVITDAIAPVADNAALTNVTDDCSATPVAPTATDNCAGTVTGTPDVSFPITAQGTTTVTWTYDDGNGNTSTQTQDVVITDAIAPVADVASLANVTEDCSATPVAPTATDNCAGTVTGTPDMSFPITAQGTTTVTWTYDDGNGNTSTQTQDVIITDAIAPVADVASLANVTEDCSATPVAPTATDNCAGTVTGTPDVSFPITAQGTTTVTWTYDDGNGNTSTQTQDVIITDAIAPVADVASLANVTEDCSATPVAPTATDNCAGTVTGTPDVSFPITAQGTTTVTWTYDDGNGNTSTQTQDVVITGVDVTVSQSGNVLTANATGVSYQWLNCDDSNAVIPGETDATFTPSVTGSYSVEITDNGCVDTSDCIAVDIASLSELSKLQITIYPNPSSGIFNIDAGNTNIEGIKVLDAMGRLVSEVFIPNQTKVDLNISNENKGIYFVEVSSETGTIVRRRIILN